MIGLLINSVQQACLDVTGNVSVCLYLTSFAWPQISNDFKPIIKQSSQNEDDNLIRHYYNYTIIEQHFDPDDIHAVRQETEDCDRLYFGN